MKDILNFNYRVLDNTYARNTLTVVDTARLAQQLSEKHDLPLLGEKGEFNLAFLALSYGELALAANNSQFTLKEVILDPEKALGDNLRKTLSGAMGKTLDIPGIPEFVEKWVIKKLISAIIDLTDKGAVIVL